MNHLEPIESAYFNWLCAKAVYVERPTPSSTYYKLLRQMQNTEFFWSVPMDDNRAADGLDLRREFLNESRYEASQEWLHLGCSVLEMIIAFTRRAAFVTERSARDWFWQILENLELTDFNDSFFVSEQKVADILDRLIWRTYDYNGQGGMWPLRYPGHDQREVEIWYQFCEYLIDNE